MSSSLGVGNVAFSGDDMASEYRRDLDVFKGLAILAVVFYHLGILKSGYLAVDLFFVINGFLIIPSVCRRIQNNEFSYWGFLKKRMIRFLPLVLIASTVCLLVGGWGMLPDDYENLSLAVIASNLMSGNILSSMTSKNYWNALNDYKPLMHVWYLGVLFEFYILFPLIMMFFNKVVRRNKAQTELSEGQYTKKVNILLITLCVISILCYLNPFTFGINPHTAEGLRFYWLQNRFFELGLGGLVGLNMSSLSGLSRYKWISPVSLLALFGVICIGLLTFDINHIGSHILVVGSATEYGTNLILPPQVLLILTVLLSCLAVAQNHTKNPLSRYVFDTRPLAFVGKMSLSIFVWHQIFIAFYRYYYTNEISWLSLLVYLAVVFAVSVVTYFFVEQKIKSSKAAWISVAAAEVLTCAAAFVVYMHAGVIRDVPELDISKSAVHRSMHAEYCDRIYKYNKEFSEDDNRIKVLVIGNSFARDWANILFESEYKDKIELSYIYSNYNLEKLNEKEHLNRIKDSDYIFLFAQKSTVPDYVWQNAGNKNNIYGIGTKNFGQNNGSIYRHRHEPDYFKMTVASNPEYEKLNALWKEGWGSHYIDFIEKVRTEDGRIRVFSDNHKFISQDCEHLTQSGAQFYASVLDIRGIFEAK